MQVLPAILAVAGPVIKGVGGFMAGQQNKRAAYAGAREEEMAGNAQALHVRDKAREAMGQQLSAQFSNGFQGGTGSALDSLFESQVNAALDAMEVRRQASAKAESMRSQGNMASTQGKFALAEGLIGAASGFMGQKADWAAASAPHSSGGSHSTGGTSGGSNGY